MRAYIDWASFAILLAFGIFNAINDLQYKTQLKTHFNLECSS